MCEEEMRKKKENVGRCSHQQKGILPAQQQRRDRLTGQQTSSWNNSMIAVNITWYWSEMLSIPAAEKIQSCWSVLTANEVTFWSFRKKQISPFSRVQVAPLGEKHNAALILNVIHAPHLRPLTFFLSKSMLNYCPKICLYNKCPPFRVEEATIKSLPHRYIEALPVYHLQCIGDTNDVEINFIYFLFIYFYNTAEQASHVHLWTSCTARVRGACQTAVTSPKR